MKTDLTTIDTAGARLPSSYHAAKKAIAQCASLDECKDWTDKAAALASYAKQANDDQLEKTAKRIRARATRRAGELLKQVDGRQGQNLPGRKEVVGDPITRMEVAAEVGMSNRQMKTATAMAQVPEDDFEEMVEADATLTAIAEAGRKPASTINRKPAKKLVAAMRLYSERIASVDIDEAVAGLTDVQKAEVAMMLSRLDAIHDRIATT